jgi:hypothetical protein
MLYLCCYHKKEWGRNDYHYIPLALVLRTPFTPEAAIINAYTSSTPGQTCSYEKIAAEAADDSDCGYLGWRESLA